jgi:hypothetical protein
LPKQIPKHAAGDGQQNEAQQKDENVLTSFSGPVEGGRIRKYTVDPYRICDVLYFAISERLISANQLVLYLLVYAARDVNLTGIGNTLKARSDIDSIAENVVCFDDNVAKIDTDPIFNPMMLRHRCVASNHVLLDDDTAPHSFDRTVENRNKSVTSGFDEPSVMSHNAGLYEVTLDPLHAKMRSFLIDLHEAAVARDIASDNRGKTARRRLSRGIATSARFQFTNFTHDLGLHALQTAALGADNY